MHCKITRAALEPYSKMVRLAPRLERDAIPPPPEFAGLPRIRCIFYVEEKDNPNTPERIRVHSWTLTEIQQLCSCLEKRYSRAIAKQAIPILVNDINGLRKPRDTRHKFQMMIDVPGIVRSFFTWSGMGVTGDDDGELFRQRIDQLFNALG